MSRVAKAPVTVPNGVTVTQGNRQVEVKEQQRYIVFQPACAGRAKTGRR